MPFVPGQSGNLKGRPVGIKENNPRNLARLQPKAERVLDDALDDGDTRVAMYVNDRNNDDVSEGLDASTVVRIIRELLKERLPAAVEIIDAQFQHEESHALPDADPAA